MNDINLDRAYKKEDAFKVKNNYRIITTSCCDHCVFIEIGYEGERYCKKINELTPNFLGAGVSATAVCDLFEQ